MEVTFTYHQHSPKRVVSEQDIAAEERQLGFRLPEELRHFLLEHDGPTPNPAWFSVDGPAGLEWHGPIVCFFRTEQPKGRGLEGGSTFWATAWGFREYQRLPGHFLPLAQIGTITRENFLLISVGANDHGTVYLWRLTKRRFRADQLKRAAGSFAELLAHLTQPPDPIRAENDRILQANHEGRFRRPPPDFYAGPEARRWLRRNRNPAPLAANHFPGAADARRFVDELYAAGATQVIIPEDHIQEHDDDGPYGDALAVFLPAAREARAAVCQRCQRELDEPVDFDVDDTNPIFLWWD
jgi:hypothetical protein